MKTVFLTTAFCLSLTLSGMPQPVECNWYGAGFFDLQINGQSIGSTFIRSLTGWTMGNRGMVDFVFDPSLAVVRIRMLANTGGDCLYAQVLLEPKQQIESIRAVTRCFPSAFVTDGNRHVRTATREVAQGSHTTLNVTDEWWTLYYDSVYDHGYVSL